MLTRRSTSKLTILNANLDPQANQHTVVYVERRTYMVWETTKLKRWGRRRGKTERKKGRELSITLFHRCILMDAGAQTFLITTHSHHIPSYTFFRHPSSRHWHVLLKGYFLSPRIYQPKLPRKSPNARALCKVCPVSLPMPVPSVKFAR